MTKIYCMKCKKKKILPQTFTKSTEPVSKRSSTWSLVLMTTHRISILMLGMRSMTVCGGSDVNIDVSLGVRTQ